MEMHAIVRGSVHGVGFRATTRHIAMGLGLTGTVRNVPDGTVEIYAQGDQASLDALIQKLQEYFGSGHIETVQTEFKNSNQTFPSFSIIH